jgi:uncharacterized protein involved in exopolysaccharide biosynthesis
MFDSISSTIQRYGIEKIEYCAAMAENLAALKQARSLLVLLLATCHQTLLALEAAANDLDIDMTGDLKAMIGRSERELEVLVAKISAAGA